MASLDLSSWREKAGIPSWQALSRAWFCHLRNGHSCWASHSGLRTSWDVEFSEMAETRSPIPHFLFKICCCCCQVASVVSDSVQPNRRQPTRLPHPWDSPGKNTGVGCRFLFQCMKVKSEREVAWSCPTLHNPMDSLQPTRLLHPLGLPGKSTGTGCHCLLHVQLVGP